MASQIEGGTVMGLGGARGWPHRHRDVSCGRPLLRSGLRQLALGGVAIAVTFTVGSLIGGHVT